jgi:ABC-type lipoprotein release transport system permease subunit
MRHGLFGVPAGAVASAMAARVTASLLYGVRPSEPLPCVAAVAPVLLVALSVCYAPAYRASRLQPSECLRSE